MKLMPSLFVEEIREEDHRYPTLGDWWFDAWEHLHVKVTRETTSALNGEDSAFCIAIHELVEAWLCRRAGMAEETVSAFDRKYEERRKPGDTSEPGDNIQCPYRAQHKFATYIEELIEKELLRYYKK